MTESQAWRILAEEHDAGRTKAEWLCCCLDDFNAEENPRLNRIPSHLLAGMQERIRTFLPPGAAYPDREYDAPDVRPARVLACLMFSEIAKERQ